MDAIEVKPFFIRMLKGLPGAVAPLIVFVAIIGLMGKFGIGSYRSWKEEGGSLSSLISSGAKGVLVESAPSRGNENLNCRVDDICYLSYRDVVVSGWCDLGLPECEGDSSE